MLHDAEGLPLAGRSGPVTLTVILYRPSCTKFTRANVMGTSSSVS